MEALEAHDPERAVACADRHCQTARDDLLTRLV
jgi:DNA-binding GntR family transcriptional regulator